MLQALHRGDTDTLRRLYRQEAAERSPLEVWHAASSGGRYDLQHAVLVLHPHQHIESRLAQAKRHAPTGAGPKPLNGELHRPLGTDAHESLIRHIKQVPYFSEKPERLTDAQLNGQVPFADGGYNGHHIIFCRHLATLWALQVLTTGKPDYAVFGTEAALKQGMPSKMQPLYERLLTAAAENHLVPLTDWGPFVTDQLRTIAASGETASKVTLVSSGSHVMAMDLKVKQEPDGPLYVANFYDPTLTATHKRIASKDLGRFEALRLDSLFKDRRSYDECFRNQSVVSVTVLPSGGEAGIPPLQPGGDPERRLTSGHPPLDESVVHHLMAGGFAGTLRDLLPEFASLGKKTPYQASSLLAGRSDDVPGLLAACMAGQAHTVRAFGQLLDQVPPYRHAWLLAARSSNDIPALRAAAAFDHADTVRAFIDCVAGTALAPAEQLPLLAAKRSQKESTALGLALALGHLDTVNAYLEGIAAHPGLSAKDRAELLSLQNEDGLPAL
ncbi:MAG TPA: ShET2/EspL2 family type III secretion system effector toxin, partial [Burkholderiaceae bacterium]|nr:ShET2/EspL2 family type III secretion system effector toxin [Burkholderiaceae bacterium]